jgi:hypothetical protein
MSLIDTLQKYQPFQQQPIDMQEVYTRLAETFEDSIDLAIYLTPKELTTKLDIGNPDQWTNFLQMEPVKIFIKSQMAQTLQIAQRKSIQAVAKEAALGNVQAAKQVAELSGALAKIDDNKIVVLHQINRPKLIPRKEVADAETSI